MSMTIRRQVGVAVTWLALVWCTPASAQKVTVVEELTLRDTFITMANGLGSRPVGEAIALATALEIGTSPFGTSSGGFVFKLDPATGLLVRAATTFGPSFSARAITSGEGQVSVGVNFRSTTYDKLSDISLDQLRLGSVTSSQPTVARIGTADLNLTSKMLVISSVVGVTENFDVGVNIPLITIELEGTTSLRNGQGVVTRLAEGTGVFSGLGDIGALAKYRFKKFGTDLPDAGGLAAVLSMRLPTGDKDNLRGLDTTRTLVSFVASGKMGRLQPHANAGYEFWSKGIDLATGPSPNDKVTAKNQSQYAAGVEVEAAPKLTLIVDFLGQHIRGAGQVGYVTDTPPANALGITSMESLVGLGEGIQKFTLIPGMKVNLKAKMLLSLHALMTLKNNGLHATVTPVVGIDLGL